MISYYSDTQYVSEWFCLYLLILFELASGKSLIVRVKLCDDFLKSEQALGLVVEPNFTRQNGINWK